MNPFDYDFKNEDELALKSGKQRFRSECDHEATVRGSVLIVNEKLLTACISQFLVTQEERARYIFINLANRR